MPAPHYSNGSCRYIRALCFKMPCNSPEMRSIYRLRWIKLSIFYYSAGQTAAGYGNGNDSGTGSTDKSIELMGSAISSHLLLECIGHLANLARLTLHALATNIMLYSIAGNMGCWVFKGWVQLNNAWALKTLYFCKVIKK